MSRALAILFAFLLLGLVIVTATTEQNPLGGSVDRDTLILNVAAQVMLAVGMVLYCGFAALHSTQYITSPQERTMWLLFTVVLNVLGSCWYYVTTYQSFRKEGKGRLMRFRKAKRTQTGTIP